jgi:microcompartment protein CcmL/EutN
MLQHIQSLAIVISTHVVPHPQHEEEVVEKEEEEVEEEKKEEDDRVSVKEEEEVEKVEGPPAEEKVDVDELQDKTATQLREMLTKKGIPFGKRDAKPVLIQLLKATA